MSFEDDFEKRKKKEDKQAAVGGVIAFFLLLLIIPPICYALSTYTTGGQILTAHGVVYLTYNGIPGADLTAGFPGLALQSCQLDQANPEPADIEQRQEQLKQRYETYATYYRRYWNRLNRLRQDTSRYEDPDTIPETLSGGKITYCYR